MARIRMQKSNGRHHRSVLPQSLEPSAGLQCNFVKARKHAGLDDGKPLRPHDLRHRFAVTRLRLWHQQRANVQALLPLLATYLGHASYSDTAYYLTGSSDLLAVAAERAFSDGGAA